MRKPTREGVLRATAKIAQILPPTPLISFQFGGVAVWAKAECLQPIGAFKIRGAWHRLTDLTAEERARGVVGVSSGNHAQGVAWAVQRLGISAAIVMPRDAPEVKLRRTEAYGAEIVLYDRATEDRDTIAAHLADERSATLVHAYADPWIIEGQGSTGIEIAAEMERWAGGPPTRIIAPCGGGGLTAGLALACPKAEIIPVEPEGWDDLCRSIEAGCIQSVGLHPPETACDALQTHATRPINFEVIKERCRFGLRVSETEIAAAQRFAFANLRSVLEPGGAAALAAVLAGKASTDGRTAVVLSGGNVDPGRFAQVLDQNGT